MAKIVLDNVQGGYDLSVINDNFNKIQEEFNNRTLYRDNVESEPNQMFQSLDMNGYGIFNLDIDPDNPSGILSVEAGDERYINRTGDSMLGPLTMDSYPITVRMPQMDNEPSRKGQLDSERSQRQAADTNLQSQISSTEPLEASAFSPISWHKQVIENSVAIPENVNAWSFGPTMSVAAGQEVIIGQDSFWTIANGEVQQ